MKRTFLICSLIGLCWQYPAAAQLRPLEDVIDEVNPSVVSIAVDVSETEQALGAGIIISADGYVVTNAHVMENGKAVSLQTPDGEIFTAALVGTDEKTDIALLKVKNPLNLEAAHFGDSDAIRVGNPVFAIGNPFGLGNSVSLGIISAKERDIDKGPYDNFLQTDASVNQGNSGGPLFNREGKIIGMSTAIFSTDGQNMGVAFATPSNIITWVVEQLKQNGKVIRGWLGVSVQKVRAEDGGQMLAISAMSENSPAAAAGLKVGDRFVSLGQIPLQNPRLFSLEIAKLKPGTSLPAIVLRDGRELAVQITISTAPTEDKKPQDSAETKKERQIRSLDELGLDKYKISKAEAFPPLGISAYYDEVGKEFVITAVVTGSEAEEKGIKVGDHLSLINNRPVYGSEDLRVRIKQAEGNRMQLLLKDGDEAYSVTLRPEIR